MQSPFDRGCIARVLGVPMVCCPHPIPTDDAENWRDGWDWAGSVLRQGMVEETGLAAARVRTVEAKCAEGDRAGAAADQRRAHPSTAWPRALDQLWLGLLSVLRHDPRAVPQDDAPARP
jgi:hypothetical protein